MHSGKTIGARLNVSLIREDGPDKALILLRAEVLFAFRLGRRG